VRKFIGRSLLLVLLATTAHAADNAPFLFGLIKKRAQLPEARLIIDDQLPIESVAFSASTETEGCTLYLHSGFVRAVSSAQLAVIMGHELAHCSLDHHRKIRETPEADVQYRTWEFEYEADALGLKFAGRPDLDTSAAFTQLMSLLPRQSGHPSGQSRVRAQRGGAREYPSSPGAIATPTSDRTGAE
jgi:hypothetical protein